MKLRPITIEDADFLLKLKNDPAVRWNSIKTNRKIYKRDHMKWLKDRLKKDGYYMIEIGNQSIGTIRFDPKEIAILVHKDYRGKGIGTEALQTALQKHTERPLFAKIVDGNIASFRLFLKMGFLPVDYEEYYYTLCLK